MASELADAKIEANEIANTITQNRGHLEHRLRISRVIAPDFKAFAPKAPWFRRPAGRAQAEARRRTQQAKGGRTGEGPPKPGRGKPTGKTTGICDRSRLQRLRPRHQPWPVPHGQRQPP